MLVMISNIFTIIVIVIHFYIMILEMFLWTKPIGLKAFRMSEEKAKSSAVLAMNQGLYNGIVAIGLTQAALSGNNEMKFFFLFSVIIFGIFGGLTVHKKVFFIQSIPALLALIPALFFK